MPLTPRDTLYCGACGMPPEYCSYSPDFESHCTPWLAKNYPHIYHKLYSKKVSTSSKDDDDDKEVENLPTAPWTTEERLVAFYTKYMPDKLEGVPALLEKYAGKEDKLFTALIKKYGDEPEDPYYTAYESDLEDDDEDEDKDEDAVAKQLAGIDLATEKKKRRGASAKKVHKVDTRIIIQKIARKKRKAVTIVVGMDTVPGVKLKDASKAFSKRFAGSSSVKDTPTGGKEIIIQGDHTEEVASLIVDQFKVPAESVFLDIDGEFVPFR